MIWVYLAGCVALLLGMSVFFGAPYVPSRRRDVRRLFDEAIPLDDTDVVLDLGSGDGLVLREVSRRGARAVGYEIHPLFVGISRLLSWRDPKIAIKWVNGWREPFPETTTIIYAFSVNRDGKRLARTVQREATRLRRPLKLICYGSPLQGISPMATFEAYFIYLIEPLHLKKA
jgi:SAM-dependent methyltransferase